MKKFWKFDNIWQSYSSLVATFLLEHGVIIYIKFDEVVTMSWWITF